jgi:aldehyde dehydrogenase (NAD+)
MANGIRPWWRNWIGGDWVDGGDGTTIPVTDPATGEVIAEVARGTPADIDRAVRAARACFDSRVLRDVRPHRRGDLMLKVAEELGKAADEIAVVECRDNGKTLANGRNEVALTQRYLTYYGGLADKLEGRQIPLGDGYVDYTVHDALRRLGPDRAVERAAPGGRALHRLCPRHRQHRGAEVARGFAAQPVPVRGSLRAGGGPKGAVNIVCGYGKEAGAALVAHPDIDHIVFTGSVETGKSVLRAAAERVIPCVMELGGKSGAIVHADADLDRTAASAVRGIFTHAGQICSAASRLIVHRSLHDDLVERIVRLASARTVGPGLDGCDMGPLISARSSPGSRRSAGGVSPKARPPSSAAPRPRLRGTSWRPRSSPASAPRCASRRRSSSAPSWSSSPSTRRRRRSPSPTAPVRPRRRGLHPRPEARPLDGRPARRGAGLRQRMVGGRGRDAVRRHEAVGLRARKGAGGASGLRPDEERRHPALSLRGRCSPRRSPSPPRSRSAPHPRRGRRRGGRGPRAPRACPWGCCARVRR